MRLAQWWDNWLAWDQVDARLTSRTIEIEHAPLALAALAPTGVAAAAEQLGHDAGLAPEHTGALVDAALIHAGLLTLQRGHVGPADVGAPPPPSGPATPTRFVLVARYLRSPLIHLALQGPFASPTCPGE